MSEKGMGNVMSEMDQVFKLLDERVLAQMMPDNPQARDAFLRMIIFYMLSI